MVVDADRPYLSRLNGVTFRPIFIMGDHRSGTTLLYQLLNATQHFNAVTAYHIINYPEIVANHLSGTEQAARQRLADRMRQLGVTDRVLDGVEVSPDLPEEYGFLIDQSSRPALRPTNLPIFLEICRKVQFIAENDRPLLLKNPWDMQNFMYIKQVFPEARFIFIHRNPLHIISSQIKALRSAFSARNAYIALMSCWYKQLFDRPLQLALARLMVSPRFQIAVRIATRHVGRTTSYFLAHQHLLAISDSIALRYEDLCAEPQATIARILGFLDLPGQCSVSLANFIQPRQARLLDEVKHNKHMIARQLVAYFTHCGYSVA